MDGLLWYSILYSLDTLTVFYFESNPGTLEDLSPLCPLVCIFIYLLLYFGKNSFWGKTISCDLADLPLAVALGNRVHQSSSMASDPSQSGEYQGDHVDSLNFLPNQPLF